MTLIELMLTLGVAGILAGGMSLVVYYQQRAFATQLDYGEAQQNARAALGLVKRYINAAGWGMVGNKEAGGMAAIGACYNDADSRDEQYNCDNVDPDATGSAGVDRLRVLGMVPAGFQAAAWIKSDVDPVPIGAKAIQAAPWPAGHPFASNSYALISGKCTGAAPASAYGTDLLKVAAQPGDASYHYKYSYTAVKSGTTALGCGSYNEGFNFGAATVADFFVTRDNPARPQLRLRLDPEQLLADAYVVAHHIDDFQWELGIDTSVPPDMVPELWCDDPTDLLADCPSGLASARENLARAVGIRVAVVARAPKVGTSGVQLQVMNHAIDGGADNLKRWVYRTSVALRNNDIRE